MIHDNEAPIWEDTLPHFSTSEKGNRITALPLNSPGMLGFITIVTFALWVPASAAGTLFFHNAIRPESGAPEAWQGILIVLYSFLPCILIGTTSDEARDRFGQRKTANRVAAIPAFAGVAVGLLIAGLWVGGFRGGIIALASVLCSLGAGGATLAAWAGIRKTRRRQAWISSMRHYGKRSPGVLRGVDFLQKWSRSDPQFTVIVEFTGESGPQRINANMTTTTCRVPQPGSPVVVTLAPDDPHGEVLIELDYTNTPEFDPNHAKYSQPSGS